MLTTVITGDDDMTDNDTERQYIRQQVTPIIQEIQIC